MGSKEYLYGCLSQRWEQGVQASAALVRRLKRTREAAKMWRKRHVSCSQRETDCKLVIDLLDRIEESRRHTQMETLLRSVVVVRILSRTVNKKLQF